MTVQLHSHIDKSYEELVTLHICCAEKGTSQANNDTIHEHCDFLAGMSDKPVAESAITKVADVGELSIPSLGS